MAAATGSVAIWRPHVTAFHRTRASQAAPCLKWRLQASRFLSMGPSVLVSSQNGYPSPRQPGMYPYTPRNLEVDVPPQPCDGTWMAIIKAHGIRGPCQHSTAQQELIAWILRGNIGFYGLLSRGSLGRGNKRAVSTRRPYRGIVPWLPPGLPRRRISLK